jgi:hypothetical protein
MADGVPWAEVTQDSWVPNFTTKRVGAIVRLSGPCPRCSHQTTTDFAPVIPGQATVRGDAQPVVLFCKCGFPHEGHPDNDNSCGAYWTITTEL